MLRCLAVDDVKYSHTVNKSIETLSLSAELSPFAWGLADAEAKSSAERN